MLVIFFCWWAVLLLPVCARVGVGNQDLRERVKAAGGGKPRSMSQELKEHEIKRAMKVGTAVVLAFSLPKLLRRCSLRLTLPILTIQCLHPPYLVQPMESAKANTCPPFPPSQMNTCLTTLVSCCKYVAPCDLLLTTFSLFFQKAKEAKEVEKKKKNATTEGKNKEVFKTLPPKVCGSHMPRIQQTAISYLATFPSSPGAFYLDLSFSPLPRPTLGSLLLPSQTQTN